MDTWLSYALFTNPIDGFTGILAAFPKFEGLECFIIPCLSRADDVSRIFSDADDGVGDADRETAL